MLTTGIIGLFVTVEELPDLEDIPVEPLRITISFFVLTVLTECELAELFFAETAPPVFEAAELALEAAAAASDDKVCRELATSVVSETAFLTRPATD